jgi:hypothetical protein
VASSGFTESVVEDAALRDMLRPKFISGELRVKNAERIIEIA